MSLMQQQLSVMLIPVPCCWHACIPGSLRTCTSHRTSTLWSPGSQAFLRTPFFGCHVAATRRSMTLFGNSVTYNKKAQFLLEGTINLDQGSIEVKKLAAGASREVYAVHGSHCVVKLEVQCPLQATKDQHRRVRAFNGRAEWRRNEHELVAFQAVGADTYAPGVPAANAVQFGTFQNMSDETVPVCALFVEELAQPDLQQPFLEAAQRGDAEALNHIIRSAVATIWRAGLAGFACADMCLENLGVCRDGQIVICDMGK